MDTAKTSRLKALPVVAALVGGAVVVGGVSVVLSRKHQQPTTPRNMVYEAAGYGGYRSPSKVIATPGSVAAPPSPLAKQADHLTLALDAYEKGHFAEAETAALKVRAVATQSGVHGSIPARRDAVKALHLMAFAAARRHDLALARDRFAQVRVEAAMLPDHGKPTERPVLGADPQPTFEENAAYQHAVCTAALGDKAGAEAEYVAFMRQYPDSPLLQAAVKRIGQMHGGDIPRADVNVWQTAMRTASVDARVQRRSESLCGPECLAELLRRQGKPVSVATLASEMGTSDEGTTVLSVEQAARRHGYPSAMGVSLTEKGLREQALPLIARVAPAHYVLVEAVTDAMGKSDDALVEVWDPDAEGIGRGAERRVALSFWRKAWQGGIAVTLGAAEIPSAKVPSMQRLTYDLPFRTSNR